MKEEERENDEDEDEEKDEEKEKSLQVYLGGVDDEDDEENDMLRRKRKRDREDEEDEEEGREGREEEDREGEDRRRRKGEIAKRGEEVINAILKRIAKFAKEKTEKGMLLIFVIAWIAAACRGMLTRNLLTGDVCLMLLILFIINLINIK